MTGDPKPRQDLIRSRCSTHNFLLSKTDPAQKKEARGRISATGLEAVVAQFSEISHGETFLHRAAAFIEKLERFEALAIRIDHFLREVTDDSGDPMRGIQQAVAAAVDRISRDAGGLWGILDEDVFGCFLPAGNACDGKAWAARIRAAMADHCEATISVGIAAHPTLDYDRTHILENALKALDHAAFFGPGTDVGFDAVSLNISGDQLYQKGDIKGAAEEYRFALRLDPANVNVLNSLGVCYGLMEAYEDALEAFASAARLAQDEVMPVYNAGVIHMLKGENEAALAQFRLAGEKEPDIFEVAFQTGRIYLECGAPDKGVPHLQRALSLNADAAAAYRMLGEALEKTGDEDGAVEAYQSAVKKNPNDAAALSALGILFDRRGENPEIAELFCRQSTQIDPENGLYLQRLGELYLRHKRVDEAMQAFEKAQALGTDCSALIAGAVQSDKN